MLIDLPWFLYPVDERMDQLNTWVFYQLGQRLGMVYYRCQEPFIHWFYEAIMAKRYVQLLREGTEKFKLDESADHAAKIFAVLDAITAKYGDNTQATIEASEVGEVQRAIASFEPLLQLELGRAPIFLVQPKGVYDTPRLINDAASVFDSVNFGFPADVIADTNQAGRCLAFNLPTAAGFHIMRATEAVIKQYMELANVTPNERNWGEYIKALKTVAPQNIRTHLSHIKDLHRNPIMHPEVTLDSQEAESLWSICTSVMCAIAKEMKKLPVGTATPPLEANP